MYIEMTKSATSCLGHHESNWLEGFQILHLNQEVPLL